MATLVINAPQYQVAVNARKSFSNVISSGVGVDYALDRSVLAKIPSVNDVLILDKTTKKAARAKFCQIRPTGKIAGNGIRRFDVVISNIINPVPYRNVRLNRCGVAII